MAPRDGKSIYYYYRQINPEVDQSIYRHDSVTWAYPCHFKLQHRPDDRVRLVLPGPGLLRGLSLQVRRQRGRAGAGEDCAQHHRGGDGNAPIGQAEL